MTENLSEREFLNDEQLDELVSIVQDYKVVNRGDGVAGGHEAAKLAVQRLAQEYHGKEPSMTNLRDAIAPAVEQVMKSQHVDRQGSAKEFLEGSIKQAAAAIAEEAFYQALGKSKSATSGFVLQ